MKSNQRSLTLEWKQERVADLTARLIKHKATNNYPELIRCMEKVFAKEKEELEIMEEAAKQSV